MGSERPVSEAYDRLAGVWAESTDENFYNELVERQMMRALLPGKCIREAQSTKDALRRFPAEAAEISGRPPFIAYKAVRDPRLRQF